MSEIKKEVKFYEALLRGHENGDVFAHVQHIERVVEIGDDGKREILSEKLLDAVPLSLATDAGGLSLKDLFPEFVQAAALGVERANAMIDSLNSQIGELTAKYNERGDLLEQAEVRAVEYRKQLRAASNIISAIRNGASPEEAVSERLAGSPEA